MKNLKLISEEIKEKYNGYKSYVLPSEQIALTKEGLLNTGKNEFLFTPEGLNQIAHIAEIPKPFFKSLDLDLRSMIFNRRFMGRLHDGKIPHKLRINLDNNSQVLGFDDPSLIRISPTTLVDAIISSLPKGLSAEQVGSGRVSVGDTMLLISLFSPDTIIEPRPRDVINGGIDIVHHVSSNAGTQVNCYLRRLVCRNGATVHLCEDNKKLRVRRLNNGRFDESDMLKQIHNRLSEVWRQIDVKLVAIQTLTTKEKISLDFLDQQRTRLSLNNRMITAINQAIEVDELGPTGTQYDIFNAISRVATHTNNLTFRQERTLSYLAGEFSQQDVHQCEKCGAWMKGLEEPSSN